jgi:hypothetical protein
MHNLITTLAFIDLLAFMVAIFLGLIHKQTNNSTYLSMAKVFTDAHIVITVSIMCFWFMMYAS